MTMSIVHLLVVTFILTTVQAEVSTAYMSSDHCAEDVVKKVKETNPQLATDFSLSNRLASNSLRVICTNYVQNNIHKVLRAVNGVTCLTQVDVPTIGELDNGIYNAYVTILKQLSIYAASPTTIPNSFGQFNDNVVGRTEAYFSSTASKIAGLCLHKSIADIE